MIQGVRHRFRDKRRSKSPDCLDSTTTTDQPDTFRFPENGRRSLPRAASMLSTDYGFSPEDWGGHQSQRSQRSQRNSARLSSISAGGVLSDCDLTRAAPPPPAQTRAASVSAVNQAGLSHGISHGATTSQRGKSVRFGENRISVFLRTPLRLWRNASDWRCPTLRRAREETLSTALTPRPSLSLAV